ncbi:P-loop containing nucleoside triphosphate hydrolase protein [Yamadazyma tenuis ATCC 10573]|uniref:p-loop containing nucleoside triphosphate hydrolase protein n=1 Tax=Candida tenuis (strain ATCC 10573 / BCRC 21748 / CBS 615 / JCM 9827 / NBRC 10315 / NRRL Y-1498 / VKM Y-70) TaxID=590646 RepID=G3AXU0_CANTC|nr:P-loop containing nucleoside triphosphate hydrolase protein [Yamadazyma tenuis ATCC 10573]EGV65694.1 P-loop containing nucleoside triphosphate hydrolase protein [Yamadazyma tenuis ATCC 10573]
MAHLENLAPLKKERRLFSFLFPKNPPPINSPEERKSYPWKDVNLLSRGIFYWLLPILAKGYQRTLVPDDLYHLTEELTVEHMHLKFDTLLQKHLDDLRQKHLKDHADLSDFKWPVHLVPLCLFKTFQLQYTMSCIFLGLSFCCQALSPLLTRKLIDFVEYRALGFERTLNKGIGYTLGSVVLIYVNGLLLNHFFHNAMVTGAQCKAILTKSVLLKSFKLTSKAKHSFPPGRITSMVTTDLSRIDLAVGFQPLVVCFPIPVIIAIGLLLKFIGVTALTGIGLFFVSLIICVLLTTKLFNTRETVVDYTDERIGLMREILTNLKVIKFYAWEMAYKLRITSVREQEMKYLFTIKVLRNFITAYAVTLPVVSSMLSFVTLWAAEAMKDAGRVFSSLSLFSILAQAIMLLPIALATGADAMIGFRRLREFLSADEYNSDLEDQLNALNTRFIIGDDYLGEKVPDADKGVALEVTNGEFVWETFNEDLENEDLWELEKIISESARHSMDLGDLNQPTSSDLSLNSADAVFNGLTNVNLRIKRNEFIVITGVIGSGKSSLLSALAGFMKLKSGDLKIYDKSVLCSQPWIQNSTVRNNITFGSPFDPVKYNKVLYACALEDDLKLLPARDMTEIGERGITLSGGQKARINLARAVYAEPDTILLDDVLSAVDSRVGKHIVNNLFNGLLKDKTRVLATHQLSFIDNADRVVFLNGDGTIDVGTIDELSARNASFRKLFEFNLVMADKKDVDEVISEDDSNRSAMQYNDIDDFAMNELGRVVEAEEKGANSISWDVYKKYIDLGSGIFGWAAAPIFIFLMCLATFCQVFTNTWLSYWMERKFPGKSDHFYVGFYVAFAFLTVIFTAIEFTMLAYMNSKSAEILNVRAVEKVLHAPMSFMDTNPLGRILNRFTKDTDSLDNEIGEQLRLFLFPLATIIGIIILCISYLPYFAVAVPFLAISFIFISNFYQASSREIKRLEAVQRSLVYNNFNETLTGMSTIKTYKAEDVFIKRNDEFINKMNEAYFLSIATQRWLSVHLDIVAAIFALIICMLCITDQFNISASSTGLLLNYVIQIVGLLSLTVRSMTQVESEMNSVERLYEYAFKLDQEAAYKQTEFQPPAEWPQTGYIQFEDVNLKYRPNLPLVLKDLNFSIYPGEKVGICGRTGAGKSSITTALYRLCELASGRILIDGLDISNMGLFDLRSRLSIIPQDPVLFQGSIRKNLDPFSESTDEKLWDSLRRAGLIDETVLEKIKATKFDPKNKMGFDQLHKFHLDQNVEDEGENFSLGERQLLALARALVRNSKILILDEATSSVDYETDSRIQETIAKEFADCTILCIAHRLKTILNYDRILVIDKGEVVEKGTPLSLFHTDGVFSNMCEKANIDAGDFEHVIAY